MWYLHLLIFVFKKFVDYISGGFRAMVEPLLDLAATPIKFKAFCIMLFIVDFVILEDRISYCPLISRRLSGHFL